MRSKGIASAKTLLSRAVLKRILHLRLRRRLTGQLLIVRFLGGSGLLPRQFGYSFHRHRPTAGADDP